MKTGKVDAHSERRIDDCRCRTSEPARIAFDGKVFDCVLVNASPGGTQVCLPALTDVPDLVTLRYPGGEMRNMRCCWQNGRHIGLIALEPVSPIGPGA